MAIPERIPETNPVEVGQILAKLYAHFSNFEDQNRQPVDLHHCQVGSIDTLIPTRIVCPPNSLSTVSYALTTEDKVQEVIISHPNATIMDRTFTSIRLLSGSGLSDDNFSMGLAPQGL